MCSRQEWWVVVEDLEPSFVSFLPEHVTKALQHAFLGFVLVLVFLPVFIPLRFLLLLPSRLLPLSLSVIFGEVAVQPWANNEVTAGGHRLTAWSGTSLCVLVHWREEIRKRERVLNKDTERKRGQLTNRERKEIQCKSIKADKNFNFYLAPCGLQNLWFKSAALFFISYKALLLSSGSIR